MTGDRSILDEQRLIPRRPRRRCRRCPQGKRAWASSRTARSSNEPLFDHVLRAIDLVLEHRMGAHGLPLMGTGDWNDGLDEIGSQGRGESVWLGLFLYSILERLVDHRRTAEGLAAASSTIWRKLARFARPWRARGAAIVISAPSTTTARKSASHGSGIWEIDALTAAWAVIAGINPERGRIVFDTALRVLERDKTILLGWPALREDSKPYLGRSSRYPEGVRENGMYCHGVQWLVRAARLLVRTVFARTGDHEAAQLLSRYGRCGCGGRSRR